MKAGAMSGKGYETSMNLGSNRGKVYIQSGFSILQKDYIPLSSNFDTTSLETDHRRDNSYSKDLKGSIKMGYTPNATDEYSLNCQYSHGAKEILYILAPIKTPGSDIGNGHTGISRVFITFRELQ